MSVTQPIDATIATIAGKTTQAGAGASVLGVVLSSEAVALVGMTVAILSFVINWYFRWKEDKRKQKEHEQRMRDLDKLRP